LPFTKNFKPLSVEGFGDFTQGQSHYPGKNSRGLGINLGVGAGYFINWTYTFLFTVPSTDIWTRLGSRR